jgi:hypothetical protein
MGLSNVTNIGNIVWRDSEGGATPYDADHAVCAESFFGNGAGAGLCIWTKDETRKNYEIFQISL